MGIDLFVPKLPTVTEITPLLLEIDIARIYSNFGPKVLELHKVLAQYFGVSEANVTTLSNATLALEGAIQTSKSTATKWISPSWTFAATNLALERSGANYTLGDIDEQWRLKGYEGYSNILDVCPFGDGLALDRFTTFQGTLLIDAAASFPALKECGEAILKETRDIGVIVSFHPTKIVPGIEGGVFISNNKSWVDSIRQWSQFGMSKGSRNSSLAGTNAKMNEYQAAVILASIEKFKTLEIEWKKIHHTAKLITSNLGLTVHPAMNFNKLSTYWIVRSEPDFIEYIEQNSPKFGFETRRWWEFGCHKMAFSQKKGHVTLPITDLIARSSIGLPFHLYMTDENFKEIEVGLLLMQKSFFERR